jgi:hypothetical protein
MVQQRPFFFTGICSGSQKSDSDRFEMVRASAAARATARPATRLPPALDVFDVACCFKPFFSHLQGIGDREPFCLPARQSRHQPRLCVVQCRLCAPTPWSHTHPLVLQARLLPLGVYARSISSAALWRCAEDPDCALTGSRGSPVQLELSQLLTRALSPPRTLRPAISARPHLRSAVCACTLFHVMLLRARLVEPWGGGAQQPHIHCLGCGVWFGY